MMTSLGHIAKILPGYPFRKKVKPDPGGDLAVVQIKDLDVTEGIQMTGIVMLRSDKLNYQRYLLDQGDLLFQSRGSRHPTSIVGEGLYGIAAAGIHVLRPDTAKVLPDYLAWWLNHPQSQARIVRDLAHGSYIPFVSKVDIARLLVPVQTLETQQRIVHVHRLQQQTSALETRLIELKEQLVDAEIYAAATQDS